MNTVDNQDITGEEEIFYLDTNNKNQTNIQQQQEGEPNSGIPPVYLQGYAMLFDQLNSDLESQQQSHCDKKNSSCKNDKNNLATFEDAMHISEIFAAARQSFMEKSWIRVGSLSSNVNNGGNGSSGGGTNEK